MTAKQYLRQIHDMEQSIRHREQSIEELRSKAMGVKSIEYGKDRVQSSPRNVVEGIIAEYTDMMNELENDRLECIRFKNKIVMQIEKLDRPEYSELLYKRYVEFKPLERIAWEMGYSYDWVRKYHGIALLNFGDKYLT